ncbi:MAG: hypothetical protein K0Q74_732 [Gammaproteobacteria bacterium]|nr:hypothetical protein [Gammaproteobacteria bacterium]
MFRELRRAWRRYFDPGRNKLDPPLETIPILAGLVQITFSVIVLGLVIAAAVGAGPFAPLAPVALLAVAVGAFWGAMIMGRAIGAALAVIAFVNPFLEHHQGKTGTMTSKPGMKPMSIVGTGLGCGLIGWESLTERRKSRLAKSKAEARRHSQGNESITMEKSRSYSDSAQASFLSTKTSSSRAGSFSEFGEETPFLAGGSTSSNNSPRESFSDLGMPPPSVARSSTASVLGRLTPDQQNLILTVQLRKQVSVNEMQLVEEAGRNYLLYKADELENTQQRLSTRRDGMISMERTAPNDIKAMLHPSIEGAEKLLARVKRVAGIHRMVKELDTDAGRDMLLKKQSELSAIVKGWDSEKMNGDDLRKTNKSVDNLLTDLEQKLDVALKAKGVALPKVAEDVQSEQPKSRGMHH